MKHEFRIGSFLIAAMRAAARIILRAAFAAGGLSEAALAENGHAPLDFQGTALVTIGDADMLASAYVDGRLGPVEGRDAFSVIPLGGDPRKLRAFDVEVSNSVAGPPSSIATSPDGRYAFVVETFGQRPPGAQTFKELKPGSKLTVVDLATLSAPRVVESIDIGTRPTSVSVSPDGRTIAIALHPLDGRQLALVPFRDGHLGAPVFVGMPGVARELEAPHVEWHPSGAYLAVTVFGRNEVVFYRVEDDGRRLAPWGNTVQVGKYPMMGRFTPDGRFFLNVNLYWGPDVAGFWVGAPRGDVTVVSFDTGTTGPSPRHSLVSRAETGVSPEGISISPDGRFVVTANLERSYLPQSDPRITWYSSLTLLSLDPATGRVASHGEFYADGILPEAAVFDASSRYVASVTYDHFDDARPGGAVEFWRIVHDNTLTAPRLVKTSYSVPVGRGPHSMVLVR
jgi:DNA-binding beta-propeller fold protein YncE